MRFKIFISIFSLCINVLQAQTILKADGLQKDFEILRKSYEQMHPGLYKYKSKKIIDAAFEKCKKALSKDQTLAEAYLNIHILTATFKCGHSYPNFYNQEDFLKQEVFEQTNALPFHFKLINDKMLVVRSADSLLQNGLEVKAINGVKVKKIINTLLPIVRADGSSDGKRKSLLENGKEQYCYFDIFYPMYYPPKNGKFDVDVYDFDTKKTTKLQVSALKHTVRDRAIKAKYKEAQLQKLSFTWLDSATAVMYIKDFNNYNDKTDYIKFYIESLHEYQQKNGQHLIIDIRNNEGGNSSEMFKLVPYITTKSIEYKELQNTWQMLSIDSALKPYVTNSDWAKWWFNQNEEGFTKTLLGQWRSKKLEAVQVFQPKEERFTGNIFLLSSATNSSAAYMMVETFKKYKLATIVGQTTGGNQKGVTSSAFFFIQLPYSKIEFDVPLIGTDLTVAKNLPDAGVEPDCFIKPSIEDAIQGIDIEMEAVKKLIQQKTAKFFKTR